MHITETWEYTRRCLNMHSVLMNSSPAMKHKLRSFQYVLNICDALCMVSLYCSAYAVVVLIPVNVSLASYYGTHTQLYAWFVSSSFLSGSVPFAVDLTFLCIFACFFIGTFYFCLSEYNNNIFGAISKGKEKAETNPDESYQEAKELRRKSANINHQTSEVPTTTLSDLTYRSAVCFVVALCVLIAVVCINVAFVYISLYQSNFAVALAQIGGQRICTLLKPLGSEISLEIAFGFHLAASRFGPA